MAIVSIFHVFATIENWTQFTIISHCDLNSKYSVQFWLQNVIFDAVLSLTQTVKTNKGNIKMHSTHVQLFINDIKL